IPNIFVARITLTDRQQLPIGVLDMLDQGIHDEKLLAVGKSNPRYKDVWNYSEIYPHILREITHFFSIYKDLEGKRVETKGWQDASVARRLILESQKAFEREQSREAPEQRVVEQVSK